VPKVDAHFHLNAESTALTDLAREDNFELITVNVDGGVRPTDNQYRMAVYHKNESPETVEFVSVFDLHHWDSTGWADEAIAKLKRSFEDGAVGIKLWKSIGMVYKD